jgi:PAS domain S-box-containing protein
MMGPFVLLRQAGKSRWVPAVRRLPRLFLLSACCIVPASAAPLRVGFEPVADRLSHTDAAGQPEGFAIDITRAVARVQGLEIIPVVKPWPQLLDDFRAGKLDVLAAAVATPEREAFIAFSVPHVDLQSSVFMRADAVRPKRLEELAALTFGTTQLSAGHDYLLRRGWSNLRFYPRLLDALAGLDRGECDAVIAVRLFGLNFLREAGLRRVIATDLEVTDLHYRLRFGVQPEARALLAQLNDGLAAIRADGTHDRIYERWIGPLEPRRVRFKDVQLYLAPLVALALAFGAALFWQRHLLRRLARQAEQLRRREERLSLVLEGSQDAFWDWDMVNDRLERSERWAAMLGYSLAEIDATQAGGRNLIHPDDLPAYNAWLPRLAAGEDRYDIEYRMRTKSGEWRWVHDRGKVVARAPDGRPLRMAGTHTDITERKRTEQALHESRELLARSAHLLEQTQSIAHVGGWEVDLRTDHLYWSSETYRLHDTTPETYRPTVETAINFYTSESRAVIATAVENCVRHGTPYDLELDLVTAKHRLIRVHTTGRAEYLGGRVVKIYGSFRDITAERTAEEDRKKLHLKMLEAQKLESLGVLAGGIAHDFNNLLTVILANATFARDAAGGAGDERLAHIETAARRAADLCRQMLAYAGKGRFIIEPVDLTLLTEGLLPLIKISIAQQAELRLELARDLPAVMADATQLRQIVMNFVLNAAEAIKAAGAPPGGTITITTGRMTADAAFLKACATGAELPPGDYVFLEVRDTGTGMAPEVLARIFEPFFTTKFAGRGLGLAAALGIVRGHHGALHVASTPGRGSGFRVLLPATDQRHSPAAGTPADHGWRRAGQVLVIEDEEPVRLVTVELLKSVGLTPHAAPDGHAGLARFRENPGAYDLVLLDLLMPGLSGEETLAALRAARPDVRVLLMSGYSEGDLLRRLAHPRSPLAFLPKPFSREVFIEKLRGLLG